MKNTSPYLVDTGRKILIYLLFNYNYKELKIDRKNVFNSTYERLKSLSPINLTQTEFRISFIGESGIDGGFRRSSLNLKLLFSRGTQTRMDNFVGI